jgi:precorrin-6B methylase 2
MLTPGEIILNKAQQKNVSESIKGGGVVVHNNITIQTANADSFRQSQRQVEDEISAISYAAMKRAGLTNKVSGNRSI